MANMVIEEIKEDQAVSGTYTNVEFKMSNKALQAIQWSDASINIFEGAVRSSKTVSANIRWYMHLCDSPYDEFLITGRTEATIYRNLVAGAYGLMGIFGESNIKWKKSDKGGSLLLMRVKETGSGRLVWKTCYVVGANDNQSETKIRGMTVAGWYADEITIHPESMVKQGILRVTNTGGKIFWTTNPDSPHHHIYTDYIAVADELGYRVFHFELRDNLALDEEYIKKVENAFTGVWHERMVQGKWVIADGLIYSNFLHKPIDQGGNLIKDKATLPKMKDYIIGIDYGQSNATTFILIGYGADNNYYVLREWYHSGREAEENNQPQMSPSQYAKAYHDFVIQRNNIGLRVIPRLTRAFLDPSAKGFLTQCREIIKEERGDIATYSAFRNADNDVDTGLQTVASLIGDSKGNRRLFVVEEDCPNLVRELGVYAWDKKASLKTGKDVVSKENDHTMDALRYGVYNFEKLLQSQRALAGRRSAVVERRRKRREA